MVSEDYNRGNRHAAYRQFILWIYGKLRAGQRKSFPAVVYGQSGTSIQNPRDNMLDFCQEDYFKKKAKKYIRDFF
jgi:hypothetical protein